MTRREFFKTLLGKSSFEQQRNITKSVMETENHHERVSFLQAKDELQKNK